MVFKSIKRIKEALPELVHLVMFYNEGTIFQTTFEHPINIPDLGKNLSESLQHIENLFEITQIKAAPYIKLIYETADFIIIILKLGEQSNIALFFEKGEDKPKISSIRRYLYRIEDLIDTDKLGLDKYTLNELKKELITFEQEIEANLQQILQKKSEISNLDLEVEKIQAQIAADKTDLTYEDTIQEKLEQIIETTEEIMEDVQEKEIKKELKREIKEDEKGLKSLEKSLSQGEKEIEKKESGIRTIENQKSSILSDINSILEENKKIQQKIDEKSLEISKLEEKIDELEKEKFERKFMD